MYITDTHTKATEDQEKNRLALLCKGVEPPLQFGERTRDCSPGQAGKEGPHLAMTGASYVFPQAAAPVGDFSRGTTRTSGSLSCGARELMSPCAWRGGAGHHSRVMGSD